MAGPSSIYEGVNPLLTSPLDLFIIQLIIVVIVAKVLSYFFKFIKRTFGLVHCSNNKQY
jgi:membrane-anchored glycerophosphoryl diester phosphodiesterase (GDPDase)